MCVAVPGKIISIGEPSTALLPAEVAFPDRTMEVNLVMLPDASVGDHVIVHSGYAIRVTTEPVNVRPEGAERMISVEMVDAGIVIEEAPPMRE
jgi:hydrogenase expression/formation protein HypC